MVTKSKNPKTGSVADFFSNSTPPPHIEPVDPGILLGDLVREIQKYIVLSDEAALAVALWVILTWCYDYFHRCPLCIVDAPERACGKSQLLKIVGMLAFRPFETANIKVAGLFRMVAEYKPCILVDECDVLLNYKSDPEMMGLFNNGFDKGGSVVRMEADKTGRWEIRAFPVYGPKLLAGISLDRHLSDAVLSRGIRIAMKRKEKTDQVQRLRDADPAVLANLRSRIHRLVQDNKEILSQGWNQFPEELSDRERDGWEPLLAIAHCCGAEWYEKAWKAAVSICAETAPPKSSANQLLEDVREILGGHKEPRISSAALLDALNARSDMDWCDFNRGQPLTVRQLAKFLSGYGIKTKTVRMGPHSTPKGYEVRDFDEAFARYLPEKVVDSEDAAPPEPKEAKPPRKGPPPVLDF